MIKLSPNGKGIIFGPNGIYPHGLNPQWKGMILCESFFFEVLMVMVRHKRKYNKKMQCQ